MSDKLEEFKAMMDEHFKQQEKVFRTDFIDFVHDMGITCADEKMKRVAKNAIPLIGKEAPDDEIPIGACKMGGYPDLPPSIEYPTMKAFYRETSTEHIIGDGAERKKETIYNIKQYKKSAMQLMAQINLTEVAPFDKEHLLPNKGMLYIFWGGELPYILENNDVFKVIYYDGDTSELKRTAPSSPYYSECSDKPFDSIRWKLEFSKNEYDITELEDELGEAYDYYQGNYDIGETKLLGYTVGSMNVDETGDDWINLFQLDFHMGCLWNLYWDIKKSDLKNLNFDNVYFKFDMD